MSPSMPVYRTIREQIADLIRADILSGRLTEGERLREQELAERYGVSRAPIRDALLQLTQEGLLVAKPNCGVRVGSAADQEIQPLIVELRRQIEVFALQKAFDRLANEWLPKLEETVELLEPACRDGELSEIVRHDVAMHRIIVEAVDNPDLLAIWLPIVSRMMLHYSRLGNMMDSYREHKGILDAIRNGDRRRAEEALIANIQ
ncbi:GntR family transcriptional regulator [Thermostilla marina]